MSLSNLPAKRDKSISSSRSGNQGLTCFSLPAFGNLLLQNSKRFEWKLVNLFGKCSYFFFLFLSFYYWTIVWIITHTETLSSFQQLLSNTNFLSSFCAFLQSCLPPLLHSLINLFPNLSTSTLPLFLTTVNLIITCFKSKNF